MADTTLLSAIVEHESEPGVMTFMLSGEPDAAAIVNAVADNYNRVLGRPKPTLEQLEAMIGQKVTLIVAGQNMLGANLVLAREGTLFAGVRGLGILPKGKRKNGRLVEPDKVIDVLDGYCTSEAQKLAGEARAHYPQLQKLTQERLEQLPRSRSSEIGTPCTLAVFGTCPMPDSIATDALWLIGEYDPEGDIVDGSVLLIRPQHGFSEHGSIYGHRLLSYPVGEVIGFQPISFSDALQLCDVDFDEALARALGTPLPAKTEVA